MEDGSGRPPSHPWQNLEVTGWQQQSLLLPQLPVLDGTAWRGSPMFF